MPATISGTTGGIGLIGSGTAQNTTSGTAIDFTGIPAGVKRITVMFNEVSTNGTSHIGVQIGAGSITSTGYVATSGQVLSAPSVGSYTTCFGIRSPNAADVNSGHMVLTSVGSNIWIASHTVKEATNALIVGAGSVTLSGTLDRVRITTVNGTDTFDAGSVNILYE